MRYLGVDFGTKKIGVAISDEKGKIAFPHKTIQNKSDRFVFAQIQNIANENQVQKIVIGLPISFSQEKTKISEKTEKFAKKLSQALDLPVDFEKEFLTTKIAKRSSPRKVDEASAALILQSYLDRIKK